MSDDDFFIFSAVPWEAFCRVCIKITIRMEVKESVEPHSCTMQCPDRRVELVSDRIATVRHWDHKAIIILQIDNITMPPSPTNQPPISGGKN